MNFHAALQKVYPVVESSPPAVWFAAFQQLIRYVESRENGRKVLFFDELPWFDTHGSGFIQVLEHFWNSWVSARDDILLVVCGSAASWMISKLINNKGGLHNCVTKRIKLVPFYWDEVKADKSAFQNINDICFSGNGLLYGEFPNLFRSLFNNCQNHEAVIDALTNKNKG